jgi:bleomycin hydrolase
MTHAMLFTGVHTLDGRSRCWRVENSLATHVGQHGSFMMNDSRFNEYVFEVVVRRQASRIARMSCAPSQSRRWDLRVLY